MSTTTGTAKFCKRRSSGAWDFELCNRELKTPEQEEAGLCGRHLAVKRRRDAKIARIDAGVAQLLADNDRARELVAQLGAALGDPAGIHPDVGGGVRLSPEVVAVVLARLAK
jgi:hypothetical protein